MDKREKIMNAAKQSFSMFGYKGTTVDQIAKIAGVGKGTIYTYFVNKEVILQSIIQAFIMELKEVAEQSIHQENSTFENLHEVLSNVLSYRNESDLLIKLSQEVKEYGTAAAREALRQIEIELVSYIQSILEKAVQNNKIRNCDPEITAFILLKLYIALTIDWNVRHEALSNDRIYQLFKLYVMEGLSNQLGEGFT